jgi:hypothetical protein
MKEKDGVLRGIRVVGSSRFIDHKFARDRAYARAQPSQFSRATAFTEKIFKFSS